jgi:hypothetical protein
MATAMTTIYPQKISFGELRPKFSQAGMSPPAGVLARQPSTL